MLSEAARTAAIKHGRGSASHARRGCGPALLAEPPRCHRHVMSGSIGMPPPSSRFVVIVVRTVGLAQLVVRHAPRHGPAMGTRSAAFRPCQSRHHRGGLLTRVPSRSDHGTGRTDSLSEGGRRAAEVGAGVDPNERLRAGPLCSPRPLLRLSAASARDHHGCDRLCAGHTSCCVGVYRRGGSRGGWRAAVRAGPIWRRASRDCAWSRSDGLSGWLV